MGNPENEQFNQEEKPQETAPEGWVDANKGWNMAHAEKGYRDAINDAKMLGLDEASIKELETEAKEAGEMAGRQYDTVTPAVNEILRVALTKKAEGFRGDFWLTHQIHFQDKTAYETEILQRLGVDIAEVKKAKHDFPDQRGAKDFKVMARVFDTKIPGIKVKIGMMENNLPEAILIIE